MIWKFTLSDDLYWSDGEKLTPDDVQFTFDYLAENYPAAGWMKNTVDSISVEDGAVVFKLNKPYSRLNLEFATYPILARHIWEKVEKPMEYTNEGENVGFGPFYIARTDLGAGVIYFQRNPYWKGTSPKFDSLEIHTFSNMDVLSLAMEKGYVDAYYKYAGTYPYASIQKLKDTGNFDFVEKDNIGLIFLGMNLETQPLSEDLLCRYPFQISGGQCQKVALDISVQAQIHNLLKNLQKDLGLAYLLISHQPEVIRFMAHETIHLEEGKISKCSYS